MKLVHRDICKPYGSDVADAERFVHSSGLDGKLAMNLDIALTAFK